MVRFCMWKRQKHQNRNTNNRISLSRNYCKMMIRRGDDRDQLKYIYSFGRFRLYVQRVFNIRERLFKKHLKWIWLFARTLGAVCFGNQTKNHNINFKVTKMKLRQYSLYVPSVRRSTNASFHTAFHNSFWASYDVFLFVILRVACYLSFMTCATWIIFLLCRMTNEILHKNISQFFERRNEIWLYLYSIKAKKLRRCIWSIWKLPYNSFQS